MDHRDQAVFVPADIEHRERVNVIGAAKGVPQGVEVRKDLPAHDPVPRLERPLGVGMLLPELHQGGLRDDMHLKQYTTLVYLVKAVCVIQPGIEPARRRVAPEAALMPPVASRVPRSAHCPQLPLPGQEPALQGRGRKGGVMMVSIPS